MDTANLRKVLFHTVYIKKSAIVSLNDATSNQPTHIENCLAMSRNIAERKGTE